MKSDLVKLEIFIANFLRKGVILSGAIIFIGWILQVNFFRNTYLPFHIYHEKPLSMTVQELWQSDCWPQLIAYAGLIILISLPIIRVISTGLIFMKQRNYHLLALVALVLLGLMISLALGFVA